VETLCRALLPHLTRGAQIHQRLLDAAAQREALEGGFDHMSVGLILTDAAGRMLFANPSAEASLRAGGPLRLDRGGALGTGRADTTEVLRRLIAQAATVLDAPLARPGDGLTLEGGADGRQTSLLVVPASRNASVLSVGHPKVMIFVVTPAAAREPSAADLRQRYGLTAAEARIAGALATGASLKEIAGRHETVRLHLKHIFAKTGTHRQADLVRLLVRALPAAVDRGAIR
jgi:DNA-binding CsgD family transcriptional regulator